MSIDYRLTLAGVTPVEVVAVRALPNPEDRPTGTGPMLSAGLSEKYGFAVTVHSGRNGYIDAVSDEGTWEWEPEEFVAVSFHADKFADFPWLVGNMLTVVRRILDTGPEDAAFVFIGDVLLLTRFDGVLVKQRREKWWDHYETANQLIPG